MDFKLDVGSGTVFVKFREPDSAIACKKTLHGRWFDGRQIELNILPDSQF